MAEVTADLASGAGFFSSNVVGPMLLLFSLGPLQHRGGGPGLPSTFLLSSVKPSSFSRIHRFFGVGGFPSGGAC